MGKALKKLNFMIEEDICRDLEALVPTGKRSRFANNALRRELELIRRNDAVGKILSARTKGKKLSNKEIIDVLARDRGTVEGKSRFSKAVSSSSSGKGQ